MSFQVKVTAEVGLHESGTKFYETLLFERVDSSEGVLIKHYGKVNQFRGMGSTKLDGDGTGPGARRENVSIWKSKGKKGEYTKSMPTAVSHGFYSSSAPMPPTGDRMVTSGVYNSADLMNAMTEHKIDNVTKGTILAKLGWRDEYDPNAGIVEEFIPEPEPSRVEDANWGTW